MMVCRFALLMMLLHACVLHVSADADSDSSESKTAEKTIRKGSTYGNYILFFLIVVGTIGYFYIQYCEKQKNAKTGAEARKADKKFRELMEEEERIEEKKARAEEKKGKKSVNKGRNFRK